LRVLRAAIVTEKKGRVSIVPDAPQVLLDPREELEGRNILDLGLFGYLVFVDVSEGV
jgi:hypothetical protein